MSNAERKRRKRAGEPFVRMEKEPTPLLRRTLSIKELTREVEARNLSDQLDRLYEAAIQEKVEL